MFENIKRLLLTWEWHEVENNQYEAVVIDTVDRKIDRMKECIMTDRTTEKEWLNEENRSIEH